MADDDYEFLKKVAAYHARVIDEATTPAESAKALKKLHELLKAHGRRASEVPAMVEWFRTHRAGDVPPHGGGRNDSSRDADPEMQARLRDDPAAAAKAAAAVLAAAAVPVGRQLAAAVRAAHQAAAARAVQLPCSSPRRSAVLLVMSKPQTMSVAVVT